MTDESDSVTDADTNVDADADADAKADRAVTSHAGRAQLALLLEVAGTPKPGNVDRRREFAELRFEHFLAGAVGSREGLAMAAGDARVGAAFERAVAGMATQRGGNTQFGALLLLAPLVRAAADADRELSPAGAAAVVEATTVEDAADFYRAFEHVDVYLGDPPADRAVPDARRGADAVPAVRDRGTTFEDVMAASADRDGVAREWTSGFERTFDAAERLLAAEGPAPGRVADVFLELLAAEPDTFIAKQHGERAARRVMVRAQEAEAGDRAHVEAFADDLVAEGLNPGTTADIAAAATYVALERGLPV